MQQRNDELLIAYLDGELGPSERCEVEGWLDIDPVAREKLAALARSAGIVRLAFDEIMHEPIPDRLIAAARGETGSTEPITKVLPFKALQGSSSAVA